MYAVVDFFFFVTDPYSVKRNVARTLNNQPVFEYILHCLRTTYKYFALPHRITKSSLPKPLNTVACISEHSKEVAKHDSDVQAKNDKFENSVLAQGPSAASSAANPCKVQALTCKETAERFGSPPGNTHITVHVENSDCIKAEVSYDDHEDGKVHHQETGSKTEKEKIGREGQHPVTAENQGLSSSKHGEPVICGKTQNVKTDSSSDLEDFQNATSEECDGLAALDNKADVAEGSIEGADEPEGALSHFAPSSQGQTSGAIHSDEEEEEEDEEPRLSIPQREDEDDIAHDNELDNACTGSGDEDALSEEDEEVDGSPKYEDLKESGKDINGALRMELNKISLKEENVHEENSTMGLSDFFYEFSKFTFTKGKVGNQCHS